MKDKIEYNSKAFKILPLKKLDKEEVGEVDETYFRTI